MLAPSSPSNLAISSWSCSIAWNSGVVPCMININKEAEGGGEKRRGEDDILFFVLGGRTCLLRTSRLAPALARSFTTL